LHLYCLGVLDEGLLERETTQLLQRLISFNTVNPPGNERPAQEYLKDLLEASGFECELLEAVANRPNLIARLPGRSEGPRLCYLGHIDTVPAKAQDWRVDPWSGQLQDGCIWGRGALDMKGQVAAEVAAASLLASSGWRPASGELKLVICVDEEAGSICGAKWLCETVPDKVACDFVVNEGGGARFDFSGKRLYEVCVAEKGVFRFRLTAEGRAGHASIPNIGDNALTKLYPALAAMAHNQPALEPVPEATAFFQSLGIGTEDGLAQALAQLSQADGRLAVLAQPMLGVTLTPTMASASEKINVIPSEAQLRVDCRAPPGLDTEQTLSRIQEVVDTGDLAVSFDETVIGNRSSIDSPLMDHIAEFVDRQDPGASLAPMLLPGFTDSRWFRSAFPDCVAYGFCPRRTMDLFEASPLIHSANERVAVSDLRLAAEFFEWLALRVCDE
jgi:acetylornithine deacetylase/succinyl-diaminopimelate desuccinylase-like protein